MQLFKKGPITLNPPYWHRGAKGMQLKKLAVVAPLVHYSMELVSWNLANSGQEALRFSYSIITDFHVHLWFSLNLSLQNVRHILADDFQLPLR